MGRTLDKASARVVGLQALMLATFVLVEAGFLLLFRDLAPDWAILTVAALVAAHAVYAGARIAIVAAGRRSVEAVIGRALLVDETIVLTSAIPILAVLWLLCPWAGSEAVYAYIVACTVAAAGLSIGSIARPPGPTGRIPSAILLPLGAALFLAVYRNDYWLPVAIALATLALGIAITRPIIERILADAWQARRASEKAYAELAEGRDTRTRFVAAASHDLGQPVQAARLFLEQAMRANDSAVRTRAMGKAQEALDAVSALAGGMLDYLRLDAQDIHARDEPVPLGPVIARVAERCEAQARQQGASIVAVPTTRAACGDAALIERCLSNLVVNAARHARCRRIVMGVRLRGERLRIVVIDDGVGIPPADRARLFEEFGQGAEAARVGAGFGFGLSAVRRIAALMNATVGYAPGRPRGSCFWIDLAAVPASAPAGRKSL